MARDAIQRAIERQAAAMAAKKEATGAVGETAVGPDSLAIGAPAGKSGQDDGPGKAEARRDLRVARPEMAATSEAATDAVADAPKTAQISRIHPHGRPSLSARIRAARNLPPLNHEFMGPQPEIQNLAGQLDNPADPDADEGMAATQVLDAAPKMEDPQTGVTAAGTEDEAVPKAVISDEMAQNKIARDINAITAFEIDMGIMAKGSQEDRDAPVAIEKTGMIERIESIEDLDALESIEAALAPLPREAEVADGPAVALDLGSSQESSAEPIESVEVEAAIAELEDDDPPAMLEALYEKFKGREADLPGILGQLFGYPAMGGRETMAMEANTAALNLNDARNHQCVIVGDPGSPTVLFCNPFDQELRPWLESLLQADLQWVLVSPGDLNAFISRREQSMRAMDSVVKDTGGKVDLGKDLDALSLASISQDSSPVVKLVHSTLYDALRAGASDIHIETGNAALEIRYRIDGVLMHVASVAGADVAEQVVSRIKVMSELDIAERRIPQDGRFKSSYDGRPIDFRVSIMPSSFGEDAVLRVLDKQAVTTQMTELTLSSLGFADNMIRSLRRLSERPYGMLLVTGPTGSGKTTTLYAALSETNSGFGKVVTIEDPVEYELPGVLQIPVNEKKGLTFARGLRSILRHDPDKIMVGEIRDPETAQIAIQSALTGHLVFTTVHANNVFDVLSRFTHMGVDPYSFVSALNGILAQRLLRVVCASCGEKITPTAAMLEATGEPLEIAQTFNWRAGRGCSECRGTGYKGRKAVGELLVLSDELREAIVERVPVRQLKELAKKEGLKTIGSAAMDMVREGVTTIEEVQRVTTMA
jgi:general secretion pathway protein E